MITNVSPKKWLLMSLGAMLLSGCATTSTDPSRQNVGTTGLLICAQDELCPVGVRLAEHPAQVPVDDTDEGSTVTFGGTVTKVENGVATISVEARFDDNKVLGAATAEVRLD